VNLLARRLRGKRLGLEVDVVLGPDERSDQAAVRVAAVV
jgi:hypothetical protein